MEEDIRRKNRQAAERQAKMREKERQARVIRINEQFAGLTKRNTEYMVKLSRALDEEGYDPSKKELALKDVYEELKLKQKEGCVAAKIYGPAAKKADDIIHGAERRKKEEPPKFWELALDNGLLMFALFCVMYGIMGLFSKKQVADAGWITLFSTAVIAGVGLGAFYKIMGNRKAKHRFLRGALAFAILLLVWFAAFAVIAKIPPKINLPLTPLGDFIFSAIGFGVRYWLKKKLGIRSTY